VISINQTLFGNKDPTQRRNCHYLILFNNPVDKQSIMTLARHMYLGHSDKFMKTFAKATKNPYGYLLVDLKPFTPEDKRVKCIEHYITQPTSQHDHETPNETIKDQWVPDMYHSSTGFKSVHIKDKPEEPVKRFENNSEGKMENKGHVCDDCGLLFDTTHDVQRHVKQWCPENDHGNKRKSEDTNDLDSKRLRQQDSDEEDEIDK